MIRTTLRNTARQLLGESTAVCPVCNEEFRDYPSRKRRYCSKECYWKDLKGKPIVPRAVTPKGAHRSPSTEFKKGHIGLNGRGENNSAWKGGISSLEGMIRSTLENDKWRVSVFKRDGYMCQDCDSRNPLRAHHKEPFAKIVQEFLRIYSQFSPIDDKDTLVRLALTYAPFWDITNGITLCNECHKECHKRRAYDSLDAS